ncbi:MAG: HPr family phosphocarrier protein [Pseudomonadota bacterium]|jgi:phosphocarrier protein HPr
MICRQLTIINKLGLHARAAAKLAATAGRFSCAIHIDRDGRLVDAKSVMSLMLLAAGQDTTLEFRFDGCDEAEACEAVASLIEERFHEEC